MPHSPTWAHPVPVRHPHSFTLPCSPPASLCSPSPCLLYPFSTFLVCTPPHPPFCNQPLSVTAGLFVYQLQGPVSAKKGDKRGCSHVVVLFLSSSPLSLSAPLCLRVHPLLSETVFRLHVCQCARSCMLCLSSVCVH